MKKLIQLSILSLILGVIISSCSTKHTLAKRHYSKGYYFAHGKSNSPKHTLAHKTTKPAPIAIRKRAESPQVIVDQQKQLSAESKNLTANIPLSASNVNRVNHFKSPATSKAKIEYKSLNLKAPLHELKQSWLSNKKIGSAHSDGSGLSLFWILILIILLLWFFGYLAGWGTGGLINLLLLIALILFILWLLRVI